MSAARTRLRLAAGRPLGKRCSACTELAESSGAPQSARTARPQTTAGVRSHLWRHDGARYRGRFSNVTSARQCHLGTRPCRSPAQRSATLARRLPAAPVCVALEKPEIATGVPGSQTKIVTHSLQVRVQSGVPRLVPIDVVYLLVHEPSSETPVVARKRASPSRAGRS